VDARPAVGTRGEDLAAELYRSLGFVVAERNYRCSHGEIDLVARRGRTLVFCEVKTRTTDRWGQPSEAVGALKQARLRRLAAHWLGERRPGPVQVRFDVVSVIVRGVRTEVTHIPDAF
jgi:putative endonuclease